MDWQPIKTVPVSETPIPVLVWLEADHLGSRVHAATYHKNIVCIGGSFSYDVPNATHWMPCPAGPNDRIEAGSTARTKG